MKNIAVINFKGGVGKTSSVYHVGIKLSEMGKRVLVVDADAQCNLSQRMRVGDEDLGITEFLKGNFESIQRYKKNLFIVRGDERIEKISLERVNLINVLEGIATKFDYVLWDCPPRIFGIQPKRTINELIVEESEIVMIPILSDQSSLLGLNKIISSIQKISQYEDVIFNVFFTKAEVHTILYKSIRGKLLEVNADILMDSVIRKNEAIPKAEMMGKSIFEYDINANGSVDYSKLCVELLKRIGDE